MEQQRTPEWFEKRKNLVTGSNVGAILGCDPFRTRDDVMRAMVRASHGAESEFKGNAATQWGTFQEENAIADLDMIHGYSVEETGFHIHPTEHWLGASPDGFCGDKVIEVKCPYGKRNDENPVFKSAQEQPHYYAQMQIEMYCTDRKECIFYQWTPHGDRVEMVYLDGGWLLGSLVLLKNFHIEFLEECKNPERHLEDKVKIIQSEIAENYKKELEALENQKGVVDHLKKQLIELADGKKCKIGGLNVYEVNKKGSVSYAKVVKDHCADVDLEPYMGKASSYWVVK